MSGAESRLVCAEPFVFIMTLRPSYSRDMQGEGAGIFRGGMRRVGMGWGGLVVGGAGQGGAGWGRVRQCETGQGRMGQDRAEQGGLRRVRQGRAGLGWVWWGGFGWSRQGHGTARRRVPDALHGQVSQP